MDAWCHSYPGFPHNSEIYSRFFECSQKIPYSKLPPMSKRPDVAVLRMCIIISLKYFMHQCGEIAKTHRLGVWVILVLSTSFIRVLKGYEVHCLGCGLGGCVDDVAQIDTLLVYSNNI